MSVRYRGRRQEVKYLVSMAQGFLVASRTTVITSEPARPTTSFASCIERMTPLPVAGDDQCPLPNRSVRRAAAAARTAAIAPASASPASEKVTCIGHLAPTTTSASE